MEEGKKREGKFKGNVKKEDFFNYYKENAKLSNFDKKKYSSFLRDLLESFSVSIVKDGLELSMHGLGKLRVRTVAKGLLNNKGELRKLKPNWKATKDYWATQYPDLTKEEIALIKNKTIIYHTNDHSNGEYYRHFWDKTNSILKYQNFYEFKASRQFSRLIASTVKNPNRKTFYYE
jgi:hypothetical protein